MPLDREQKVLRVQRESYTDRKCELCVLEVAENAEWGKQHD